MTSYPTAAELKQRFTKLMAGIQAGTIDTCPSDTGLDDETIAALEKLVAAKASGHPNMIEVAAADAETEFRNMLDGTHYRQHRAADREFFARLATQRNQQPPPPAVTMRDAANGEVNLWTT